MKRIIVLLIFGVTQIQCNSAEIAQELFFINAVAQQSTGNIIVTGTVIDDSVPSQFVARFTALGALDITFGSNGIARNVLNNNMTGANLVIQSDNSIIVVGSTQVSGARQLTVSKYTSNGIIDNTFANAGTAIASIANGSIATSVLIQSTGSFVVTGNANNNGVSQIVLTRYTSSGILDTSFGTNGVAQISFGTNSSAAASAQDANGNILIGGLTSINGIGSFLVARFSSNGSLDTTFGNSGITTTQINQYAQASSIAIANDGTIILGGSTNTGSKFNAVLVRYVSAGTIDTTFGTNGIVQTATGNNSQINAISLQSDGKIIGVGSSDNNFLISRYTTTGTLDSSYGTAGSTIVVIENSNDIAQAVFLDASNNAIVAGSSQQDGAIIRLNNAGIWDQSFGYNGIAKIYSLTSKFNVAFLFESQPSGRNGGTFISGLWLTRNLNTILGNASFVQLNNNQFILKSGLYQINCSAPANRVQHHQARLFNITTNTAVEYGTSECAASGTQGGQSTSEVKSLISLSSANTFVLQHQCSITEENDGFGIATGFAHNEIFARVTITKLQ